jgi:hypothetical protein
VSENDRQTIVGCGRSVDRQQLVVVDPQTRTICPANQVGEIWLAGPGVAQGYWAKPEETEQTFLAHLADNNQGPFLRTGDLGFLAQDELFITGRLKDLLIIRGRNYYPQDIEQVAEASHPALPLNGGAAFGLEVEQEERLAIVFELDRRYHKAESEFDAIAGAIRAAVAENFELETYVVVLIKTGHLPRTTSGKVQRRRCREQFLAQTLPILGLSWQQPLLSQPASPQIEADGNLSPIYQQVEMVVRAQLAQLLNSSPDQINLSQPIQTLGLGWLQAGALKFQLEDEFALDLPVGLFFEDMTLAQFLNRIINLMASARG